MGSRVGGGTTIDCIGQSGEGEGSPLRFLEDEDKGVGITLPYGVCC